ncbi:hypothetical protein [Pontibacter chinhatensis]|uniref:Lipoprotein n=1 Tax=Pontibacter chinhatensis TaxID=1436961 RepID=A0A1I2VI66_9BACT|nr:hypothetical protein [Pontibacter chinhatensis]SFG86891.1 hypothetical protein SAMN05421739_104132 [Pontibacter chinhatensis]
MIRTIFFLSLFVLASCGKQDDFYTVTKIVRLQDTITVDQPFEFELVLKNDSLDVTKLTIDKQVQKSLFFNLFFRCDEELLRSEVKNPTSKGHNYEVHYLSKGDSLTYKMRAVLRAFSVDSLALEIEGYERVYRLKKPKCRELKVSFGGMWLPGNSSLFDAMEGYGFGRTIMVEQEGYFR